MTQKEFNNIVKKYLEGNCTPEEERKVEKWYDAQRFDSLDLETGEMQSIETEMWSRIEEKALIRKKFFSLKVRWVAGAAAALLLFAGMYYWATNKGHELNSETLAENKTVLLPDGSEVVLAENSQVYFDKKFNINHRNVTLVGSAFFNVKPDRTKPFIIVSGELVTEVIGTSFEIAQNPDLDVIEVKVVTGEVTVYNPTLKKQTKVVLSPNEKAVYNKLFKNVNRTLVEAPQPLTSKTDEEAKFVFTNTSLRKVADTFKEIYGINFKINDKNIEDCLINADLENLPMFVKLDLVCKSIDASYTIDGTTVFLNGEGCD